MSQGFRSVSEGANLCPTRGAPRLAKAGAFAYACEACRLGDPSAFATHFNLGVLSYKRGNRMRLLPNFRRPYV